MPVILARIDDRLIHGQVTEGWCPKLKPEYILVVSDDVAISELHSELCLASLPSSLEGEITGVDEAPGIINMLDSNSRAAYVLFETPKDVYTVVKNGARLSRVNIGGMHSTRGKREILDYIYVDDNDIRYLKGLVGLGVELDFRDLPDHVNTDVMSRL